MLGEKELDVYLKKDEDIKEEKKVDVNAVFEAVNENLARLIEAMGDLGAILNNEDDKVEDVEEVKEMETEEIKEEE